MDEEKLIWRIFVDTETIRYECAKCDWAQEYEYPFVHNQKRSEAVLSKHLKACK